VFAVDEGIFGALGVKVNSVPGTIDRCTVEEVVNALVTWDSVGDCDKNYGWEGVLESLEFGA